MPSTLRDTAPASLSLPEAERIGLMDGLRGIALAGVFAINIDFFNRPVHALGMGIGDAAGIDRVAAVLALALVQGKFWVLFSLLFGMGFAVMARRAEAAGRPFVARFLRRTLLLALFGALHIALFWVGDILLTYAMAALLLLVFLRLRGAALWIVGGLLYVGPVLALALFGVLIQLAPAGAREGINAEFAALAANGAAAAVVYATGDFAAVAAQRLADYTALALPNSAFLLSSVLGVFLIGVWLVRSGRLDDVAGNRAFFLRMAIAGIVVGAPLVALSLAIGVEFDPLTDGGRATLATSTMMLGSLPLALGYFALLALLSLTASGGRWVAAFAPVGRMALTHYLMQSVIASLLFYGYGLGLAGEVGRATQLGMVAVVFIAQLVFSHWWLARFQYGPMEWLWRAGTHLALPPFHRGGRRG
ncbi:MAG TPA: hypothetical protein DCM32_06430 [Xanthomonadaceae bacterium]|nr:hypothetical protein [Xanthomonadaceae bacterium]